MRDGVGLAGIYRMRFVDSFVERWGGEGRGLMVRVRHEVAL